MRAVIGMRILITMTDDAATAALLDLLEFDFALAEAAEPLPAPPMAPRFACETSRPPARRPS